MRTARISIAVWLLAASPLAAEPPATENGVRYAQRFATGGSGTLSDPWTGWESAVVEGRQVHFRAGHYATADGIDVRIRTQNEASGTGITGDGMHATFIRVTSPDRPALRVRGNERYRPPLALGFLLEGITFFAGANHAGGALVRLEHLEQSWSLRNVVLRNGPIDARGDAAHDVGIGLDLYHCSHGVIENLVVRGSRSADGDNFVTGLRIFNDDGIQRGNNTFLGGLIQQSRVGVHIRSEGNSSNNNTFVNLKVVRGNYHGGTVGFLLEEGSWGTDILNTHVEGFEHGIDISAGGSVNVIGGLVSFASDQPLRPKKAREGAAIHIHGTALGVTIVSPFIATSHTGVLVEDRAARVTYIPGIAEPPSGIDDWKHWQDRSSMAHTNRLGDDHPPHNLVNTELSGVDGARGPALSGKLLDFVARDAAGGQKWRARWQVLHDGLGLRAFDENDAWVEDDGGGNLFVWNKAANRIEFDIDTRVGGNQAGAGIKLGVRGETQIDGDLRLTPGSRLGLGTRTLWHDESDDTLRLDDSAARSGDGGRPVLTGSGSESWGVVLWGTAGDEETSTGDAVCSRAGLSCVAASEPDGTALSCGRRPSGRFHAYCK